MNGKGAPPEQDLRAGHRERLRARFAADPSALSDAEILELALGHVYLRMDNNILAKRLIRERGGIAEVLSSSPEDLEGIEGCGAPVGRFLSLLRELHARASAGSAMQKPSLTLADVAALAKSRLGPLKTEEIWGAFLDRQNRLIVFKKIRKGASDHVALEPLDVVEQMVRCHANSLVLAHNHPGGSTAPSIGDREVTESVASALDALGLHLHDHLIVAAGSCLSMVRGCLI